MIDRLPLTLCSTLAVADVEHHKESGEGSTRGRHHEDRRVVRRRVAVVPVVVQNQAEKDQGSCKCNLIYVELEKEQ